MSPPAQRGPGGAPPWPPEAHKPPLSGILQLAWTQRRRLLGAGGGMAASAVGGAAYAWLLGPLFQTLFAAAGGPTWGLTRTSVAAALIAAALLKALGHLAQRRLLAAAAADLGLQLRQRALAALLDASLLQRAPLRGGDIAARLTHDVEQVQEAVTEGVAAGLRDALAAAALLAVALSRDAALTGIALLLVPAAALGLGRLSRRLRATWRRAADARGELAALSSELVANLDAVQVDGMAPEVQRRVKNLGDDLARRQVQAASARALQHAGAEIVGVGGLALALLWAAWRIEGGALAPADLLSFFAALALLYEPLKGLSRVHAATQSGVAALERVEALLHLPEPVTAADKSTEPMQSCEISQGFTTLELRGVGLRYGPEGWAVRGVNAHLRAGEVIALTGPSGAGKTSVVRALLGLLPLSEGALLADGQPIDPGAPGWRSQLAWAGQDVLLFDASVADNLRLACPDASDDALTAAARAAGADAFIQQLPEGYATRLGERGARLSGGQRQRLAIARALLKGGHLLILDEALTGLEPPLRAAILSHLRRETPHRIVLLIAHDPSVQALADRCWPLPSPPLPLEPA